MAQQSLTFLNVFLIYIDSTFYNFELNLIAQHRHFKHFGRVVLRDTQQQVILRLVRELVNVVVVSCKRKFQRTRSSVKAIKVAL